eukprot:SAG31_NODE_4337_length_3343_cov_8.468249_1_plen_713_part_00
MDGVVQLHPQLDRDTYMLVASPDGAKPGDVVIVNAPDGSELEVQVPVGTGPGGEFEVYIGDLSRQNVHEVPSDSNMILHDRCNLPIGTAVVAARELARAQLRLHSSHSDHIESGQLMAPFSTRTTMDKDQGSALKVDRQQPLLNEPQVRIDMRGESLQGFPARDSQFSSKNQDQAGVKSDDHALASSAHVAHQGPAEDVAVAEVETAVAAARDKVRARLRRDFSEALDRSADQVQQTSDDTSRTSSNSASIEPAEGVPSRQTAMAGAQDEIHASLQQKQEMHSKHIHMADPCSNEDGGRIPTSSSAASSNGALRSSDTGENALTPADWGSKSPLEAEQVARHHAEAHALAASLLCAVLVEQHRETTVQNERTEQKLQTSIREHQRALRELEQEHAKSIEYHTSINRLCAATAVGDATRMLSRAEEANETQRKTTAAEHETALQMQNDAHAQMLSAQAAAAAAEFEKHRLSSEEAQAVLVQQHQVELSARCAEHERMCAQLVSEIEEMRAQLGQAYEQLRQSDSDTLAREASHKNKIELLVTENKAALQMQNDAHAQMLSAQAAAAAAELEKHRLSSEEAQAVLVQQHQVELSARCAEHERMCAQLVSEHKEAKAELVSKTEAELLSARRKCNADILVVRKKHEELMHTTSWRARVGVEQEVQQKVKEEIRRKLEDEKQILRSELADEHEAKLRASQQRAAEIGRAMMGIMRK